MAKNMHNHEHDGCKHDNISYCERCDVAYCEDCSKEWGNEYNYSFPNYPIRENYPLNGDWIWNGTQ